MQALERAVVARPIMQSSSEQVRHLVVAEGITQPAGIGCKEDIAVLLSMEVQADLARCVTRESEHFHRAIAEEIAAFIHEGQSLGQVLRQQPG